MRLTAILLTVCCLQVSASGWSQKITFSGKNVPLELVLSAIKSQTNYFVAYDPGMLHLSKPVTINLENVDLREFLTIVFKGQPLDWSIEKSTIFVQEKEAEVPSVRHIITSSPPIKGIVKDADGKPLTGVNILIKGSNKGTTTDASGNFSIDADANDILIISSVGYAAKEVKVNGDNSINIMLALSMSPLDEVQVIAYGTTSKRLNTGNVSTVKAAEIEKQPVANPLAALQGRVPGLSIIQKTGVTGGGFSVQIRGRNSILNGNDPLYIIDGVPFLSQLPANINPFGGNPLNFINSADIESIDVLKDGDATAIYGSRGANGVILITTKKGTAKTSKVNASFIPVSVKPYLRRSGLIANNILQCETKHSKTMERLSMNLHHPILRCGIQPDTPTGRKY